MDRLLPGLTLKGTAMAKSNKGRARKEEWIMRVLKLGEFGENIAMHGLALNKNQLPQDMPPVADRLACMDGGHNKFLESIVVWLDITAPRYWWSQFDTYRVGVTKQSESTMHTIMKRGLTEDDFEDKLFGHTYLIHTLNDAIKAGLFDTVKALLPESFLQRRIVCTNYKALRNIYHQRKNHRLSQWQMFTHALEDQLNRPNWVTDEHSNRRRDNQAT